MALGLALACLLLGIYFAGAHSAAVHVQRANQLGLEGRYQAAVAEAGRVHSGPEAAQALLTSAYAYAALGELDAASSEFAAAARLEPNNWLIYYQWAPVLSRLGQDQQAAVAGARARSLNPKLSGG